jgi:hypothetical protein
VEVAIEVERGGRKGHRVRGWERWVNPGDFREVNGMASVWHASGICTDARRVGEALTLGSESGYEAKDYLSAIVVLWFL